MIVEIKTLEHVIMFRMQKMVLAGQSKPVLSFSALWHFCSNAAANMKEQGIHHPVLEKKLFARQFFESIDLLHSSGTCLKREEDNGPRKQLINLSLTDAGKDRISTIIFGAQERARQPEIIWNPKAMKRYRGQLY